MTNLNFLNIPLYPRVPVPVCSLLLSNPTLLCLCWAVWHSDLEGLFLVFSVLLWLEPGLKSSDFHLLSQLRPCKFNTKLLCKIAFWAFQEKIQNVPFAVSLAKATALAPREWRFLLLCWAPCGSAVAAGNRLTPTSPVQFRSHLTVS
jgi:hypothetical protein